MNEEITRILKDILFQLHVISSQNYTAMSMTDGEDPISEKTREYVSMMAQVIKQMNAEIQ